MDGDPKQARTVSVDRMEPCREGHRYDSATTARPLPPDHPLVKRANDDMYVEDIFHSEATDQEASNPWWPWSTADANSSQFPAMPQQPSGEPDDEALCARPAAEPADEILGADAESGERSGEPAAAQPAHAVEPNRSPPVRGRATGARPK